MPGNRGLARGLGEQPSARQIARNEGEAHQMSPENWNPMEPSPFSEDEGYQDWTKVNPAKSGRDQNDGRSSHRHGVVCGHGISGQVVVLKEEICAGGRQRPNGGCKRQPREARLARAEVGEAYSTSEAANHRGGKGPHLVEVNSEAEDW